MARCQFGFSFLSESSWWGNAPFQTHEILQAVWNQGVDDLIKFWSELCSFSTMIFCINKHIAGGIVFYKHF